MLQVGSQGVWQKKSNLQNVPWFWNSFPNHYQQLPDDLASAFKTNIRCSDRITHLTTETHPPPPPYYSLATESSMSSHDLPAWESMFTVNTGLEREKQSDFSQIFSQTYNTEAWICSIWTSENVILITIFCGVCAALCALFCVCTAPNAECSSSPVCADPPAPPPGSAGSAASRSARSEPPSEPRCSPSPRSAPPPAGTQDTINKSESMHTRMKNMQCDIRWI